jgi:hypothetical protein
MKNFIITIILLSAVFVTGLAGWLASTNLLRPAKIETKVEETFYALTTKVVMIDYTTDIVWCEDYNGNIWEFYGCEDWAIDDIASLLMNDKGTENIEDDEIMSARYNGTFEGWR